MHYQDNEPENNLPEEVPLTPNLPPDAPTATTSERFKSMPRKNVIKKDKRTLRAYVESNQLEEKIWNFYKECADNEKTINFIKSLNIPKRTLPTSKKGYLMLIDYLDKKFTGKIKPIVKQSSFETLLDGIDDILDLPAGPTGAVYQNLIKISLENIVELEKGYADAGSSDAEKIKKYRDVQDAILKYVAQIKGFLDKVRECYVEEEEVKKKVKQYAVVEAEKILGMVRDTVQEVFPAKAKEFKAALIMKMGKSYQDLGK